MSLAVVYRSDARFDIAFRQIRSSSLGIVSSICRGGRASVVAIRSSSSLRASSLSWALAMNGRRPVKQFVENHAQAEDVRSTIDPMPFAPSLLGTHVRGCPGNPATPAEILVLERQTEVGDERLARAVDQDVGGLDVPVDQARVWA